MHLSAKFPHSTQSYGDPKLYIPSCIKRPFCSGIHDVEKLKFILFFGHSRVEF